MTRWPIWTTTYLCSALRPACPPADILLNFSELRRLRVPMVKGSRSLNLSNTVAIILYEAWAADAVFERSVRRRPWKNRKVPFRNDT